MITLKFKIGKAVIEVAGRNEKELIEDASLFYELPCECGLCKSTNLGFRHRRTTDYDFYEMLCLECRATYAFGQKKEGGGLFPKGKDGDWEPKYERQERSDDRGDSRNDRRRDDPPPRQGRSTEREDDRRNRHADERRTEKPRDREQSRPTADDDSDIPF